MFVHEPPTQCDKKPLTTFHDGILRVDQKVHAELFKEVTQCLYRLVIVSTLSVQKGHPVWIQISQYIPSRADRHNIFPGNILLQ